MGKGRGMERDRKTRVGNGEKGNGGGKGKGKMGGTGQGMGWGREGKGKGGRGGKGVRGLQPPPQTLIPGAAIANCPRVMVAITCFVPGAGKFPRYAAALFDLIG